MKRKIFTVFLIFAIAITSLTFFTPSSLAKENNAVATLALMLPESDIIVAIDMNKTLNVVGPSLLNQDAKKIENLKKLMKSLENVVGMNPYEVNQIVAGIKLPAVEEKDFLSKLDFTVIFRTARSNDTMLEEWSKKIDAIEEFNLEKEPSEQYLDAFKRFRYYKLSKEETEKVTKLNKDFDEILKKSGAVNILLNGMPKPSKTNKLHKDSLKRNKVISEVINQMQAFLKKDADIKNSRDASIKLQNRWYEIALEDPKRVEKLAVILKEAKEIYPNYRAKVENLAKIDALINISKWEFYDKLSKKSFGLPGENDFEKSPHEMMKEKMDETLKVFANSATPANKLKTVSKNLQRLEDALNICLKEVDEVEKFDEIIESTSAPKTNKSVTKSIKENAKISEVNGKRMITIDPDKISFWNPAFDLIEETPEPSKEAKAESPTKIGEVKVESSPTKIGEVKSEYKIAVATEKKEPEKKPELFAIGYLDETTMVIGYESGIRTILNRKSDYKNPKAAEMLNTFKNPLVSMATNSKIFQNFLLGMTPTTAKKEEKKVTPTDKFFNDLNMFGAIEYDDDGTATNDLIMSLGFTKNKVEQVFSIEADEEESSVFEVGDYEISKAIFYDLLNTLKAFKASVSFKFEKQKVAALIESAPQIIEDARFSKSNRKTKLEKTKIKQVQNLEDILTSPKFYTDIFRAIANKK